MKLKFFITILVSFFLLHCDGPAESERNVCERNQERGLTSNEFDCFFWYITVRNPSEKDIQFFLYCADKLGNKCDEKSDIKPWWL